MYCPKCYKLNDDENLHCSNCGYDLHKKPFSLSSPFTPKKIFVIIAFLLVLNFCINLCFWMFADTLNYPYNDGIAYLLDKEYYPNEPPHGNCGEAVYALERIKESNIAKFNQDYIGNHVFIDGVIFSIHEDHIILGYRNIAGAGSLAAIGANGGIRVYLPKKDLVDLEQFDMVSVYGKLSKDRTYANIVVIKNARLEDTWSPYE